MLTLDFVIKFLHLEERRNARTATILQGETGVGKTFLLHVYAQLVSQLVSPQEKTEPGFFVQLNKIMDGFHRPIEKQANQAHAAFVLAQAAPADDLDSFSEKWQEQEERAGLVKQQIELAKSFAPLGQEDTKKLDSRHDLDTLADLVKMAGRLGRALAQACRVPLPGLSLFTGLGAELGEALLSSLRDWVNKVCRRTEIDRALFIYLERQLRENDDVDVTLLVRFWRDMADVKRAEYLEDGDLGWQQYITSLLNVTVAKLGFCELKATVQVAAGTITPDFKTVRDFCSVPMGYNAFKAFFAVVQAAIFSVKRSSFFHLDVHGGLQFPELKLFIRYVSSYATRNPSANITAFLDEVNTASILGSFQEIMVDRSLEGKALPENIFWVGAINPPRTDSSVFESEDLDQGRRAVLDMYNVRPLPEGWMQMVWDYGALDDEQEKDYVNAKLELWSANLRREMAHEYLQDAHRYASSNICRSCRTTGHWTRNCPKPSHPTVVEKEVDQNMCKAEHALLSALHILPGSKSRFDRARAEARRRLSVEESEEKKMFDPDRFLHQELDDKILNEHGKESAEVAWSLQPDEHKHEKKNSPATHRENRSLEPSNVHKLLIGIDGAVASLANLVVEAQKFVRECHGVSAVSQRGMNMRSFMIDCVYCQVCVVLVIFSVCARYRHSTSF